MLGVIAGDIIGSVYEGTPNNIKTKDFILFTDKSRFTDDSVLTCATIEKLLYNKTYREVYRDYGRMYPDAGYGRMFIEWFSGDNQITYGSWGNGSAMRVCPIGLLLNHDALVMNEAAESSIVTHSHAEAIRGAQAVAMSVFMALNYFSKDEIKSAIESRFGYDLSFDLDELKKTYVHDVSAKGTVPVAIKCFLESTDFEDAIRLGISIGGDSDTIAAIIGGIAEPFYDGVPNHIIEGVMKIIPQHFKDLLNKLYCNRFYPFMTDKIFV